MAYSPFGTAPRPMNNRARQEPLGAMNARMGGTQIKPVTQPVMNFGLGGTPEFDREAVMANYQQMYPDQDPAALGNFADDQMQKTMAEYQRRRQLEAQGEAGAMPNTIPQRSSPMGQAIRNPGAGIGYAPRTR